MASKEQQWATRYAELSAQAEMRASARRLETDSEAERRLQTVTAEMLSLIHI